MLTVIAFTMLGSYIGAHTSSDVIGYGLIVSATFLGGKFLVAPVKSPLENIAESLNREHVWVAILSAAVIGFIIGGTPDLSIRITRIFSATAGARFSSICADRAPAKTLNFTVGILLGIGLSMLFKQCLVLIK